MKTKTVKREAEEYINYVDILSYALALSWDGKKDRQSFTPDYSIWHSAVHEIREKFGNRVPELQNIFFSYRPPLAPFSDEVSHWLSCLRMSTLIVTYLMPPDHDIEMTRSQRKSILRLEEKRLCHFKPTISGMAKIFAKHLIRSSRNQ